MGGGGGGGGVMVSAHTNNVCVCVCVCVRSCVRVITYYRDIGRVLVLDHRNSVLPPNNNTSPSIF